MHDKYLSLPVLHKDDDCNYILSLLVAVPPVTEKLTTTSEGRGASEGMKFTIMGRIISTTSSSTTLPGNGCKNAKSIATINHECVCAENRSSYMILLKNEVGTVIPLATFLLTSALLSSSLNRVVCIAQFSVMSIRNCGSLPF